MGFGARAQPWLKFGIDLDSFPAGPSKAPVSVEWLDVGKHQDLFFYGGIFAIHQHPDGALEARTGWAVVDSGSSEPKKI